MATKLFLRSTQNNGIGATYFDMVTTQSPNPSTAVVDTVGSGTEIQWTQTAGGSVIQWVSGRAPAGGFTLTSTDIQIWAKESNGTANCGGRYRVFKRTSGGTETELGGGPFNDGVEFGTSSAAMTWIGNVTDTVFAEDDRILLKIYITNVGTMGSGRTCTLSYDGNTGISDSWLNLAETITFKGESTTLTPSLFTNSQTFPAPTVTNLNSVTPDLFANGNSFFAATVTNVWNIQPNLLTNSQSFFSPTVTRGTVNLSPSLFTNTQSFFSPTVTNSNSVLPPLLTNNQSFFSPTVTGTGPQNLSAGLFSNISVFYSHGVTQSEVWKFSNIRFLTGKPHLTRKR